MAQNQTIYYLTKLGFTCVKEYEVVSRDNTTNKSGRVDIIAIKNNIKLVIEFDNKSPRKKSIHKLNLLDDSFVKIVLLRGIAEQYKIDNIFVIPIPLKEV